MTPPSSSRFARRVVVAAFVLMAAAVQAQMQTPPPNVPPSARPVARPTPPSLPSRAPPSAASASAPELAPAATGAAPQTPTQLGQPQVSIPLGKPADAAPRSAAPTVAVPPPTAASRIKARATRSKQPPSAADCETLNTASSRTGCRDGGSPSPR